MSKTKLERGDIKLLAQLFDVHPSSLSRILKNKKPHRYKEEVAKILEETKGEPGGFRHKLEAILKKRTTRDKQLSDILNSNIFQRKK